MELTAHCQLSCYRECERLHSTILSIHRRNETDWPFHVGFAKDFSAPREGGRIKHSDLVKANNLSLFMDEVGRWRRPATLFKRKRGKYNYRRQIQPAEANNLRSLDGDVIHNQIGRLLLSQFPSFFLPLHGNVFIHPARRQNSNDARLP